MHLAVVRGRGQGGALQHLALPQRDALDGEHRDLIAHAVGRVALRGPDGDRVAVARPVRAGVQVQSRIPRLRARSLAPAPSTGPLVDIPSQDRVVAPGCWTGTEMVWPAATTLSRSPEGIPGQMNMAPSPVTVPPGVTPAACGAGAERPKPQPSAWAASGARCRWRPRVEHRQQASGCGDDHLGRLLPTPGARPQCHPDGVQAPEPGQRPVRSVMAAARCRIAARALGG